MFQLDHSRFCFSSKDFLCCRFLKSLGNLWTHIKDNSFYAGYQVFQKNLLFVLLSKAFTI